MYVLFILYIHITAYMYVCVCIYQYIHIYTYIGGERESWWSLFVVVMFCEVTMITELANTQPLLPGEIQG